MARLHSNKKGETTMRIITIAALAALSLNSYAVEYTPDTDVDYDIIHMHDTTTWERLCESFDGVCDVPSGTYQVKLLDRNWNELDVLRDVSVRDSGSDSVHAPDLTAEVCALYQVLDDQSLLGSLSIPAICTPFDSEGAPIDWGACPCVQEGGAWLVSTPPISLSTPRGSLPGEIFGISGVGWGYESTIGTQFVALYPQGGPVPEAFRCGANLDGGGTGSEHFPADYGGALYDCYKGLEALNSTSAQ